MAKETLMRKQAVKMLKLLNVKKPIIKEFETKSRIGLSDQGLGCYLSRNVPWEKEILNEIDRFENRTGNLVYHVIHSETQYGTIWNLLYVSKYSDEWSDMMSLAREGLVYAYAYNETYPELSEAGSIKVEADPFWGGLYRIA